VAVAVAFQHGTWYLIMKSQKGELGEAREKIDADIQRRRVNDNQ
jgi:hypothetical protein